MMARLNLYLKHVRPLLLLPGYDLNRLFIWPFSEPISGKTNIIDVLKKGHIAIPGASFVREIGMKLIDQHAKTCGMSKLRHNLAFFSGNLHEQAGTKTLASAGHVMGESEEGVEDLVCLKQTKTKNVATTLHVDNSSAHVHCRNKKTGSGGEAVESVDILRSKPNTTKNLTATLRIDRCGHAQTKISQTPLAYN